MIKMDVVIPISYRDVQTVIRNKDYFLCNLSASRIVVIGNDKVHDLLANVNDIVFINENNIYKNLNYKSIQETLEKRTNSASRRTGWYLQQFIKMAYSFICTERSYLVWDSDTIPLNKIDFEKNGKWLYSLKNEFYSPYFEEIKILFPNIKKFNPNGSYITEHMVFDTEIMRELVREIENNNKLYGNLFYEKILNSIPEKNLALSGFSEFETYGTYVYNYYPNKYEYRQLKVMRHGKIYFGEKPTKDELIWAKESFDTISFEHFEKEWKVVSALSRKYSKDRKKTMEQLDISVGKIIDKYHKFRRLVKEILRK